VRRQHGHDIKLYLETLERLAIQRDDQVETRKIQIPKRGCNIQDWQPDTSGFKLPPKLSIQ
jgi:hypothetical protein